MVERRLRGEVERAITTKLNSRKVLLSQLRISPQQQRVVADTVLEFIGMEHDELLETAEQVAPTDRILTQYRRDEKEFIRQGVSDPSDEADHLLAVRLGDLICKSRLLDLSSSSRRGVNVGSQITREVLNEFRRKGRGQRE
jgi:hypothetical protein